MFGASLYARSVLINNISASELSWKFIKSALLVGFLHFFSEKSVFDSSSQEEERKKRTNTNFLVKKEKKGDLIKHSSSGVHDFQKFLVEFPSLSRSPKIFV